MYSPKIHEKHIPALYQLGQQINKPMTHLVNEAVTEYLANNILDTSNKPSARRTPRLTAY